MIIRTLNRSDSSESTFRHVDVQTSELPRNVCIL